MLYIVQNLSYALYNAFGKWYVFAVVGLWVFLLLNPAEHFELVAGAILWVFLKVFMIVGGLFLGG